VSGSPEAAEGGVEGSRAAFLGRAKCRDFPANHHGRENGGREILRHGSRCSPAQDDGKGQRTMIHGEFDLAYRAGTAANHESCHQLERSERNAPSAWNAAAGIECRERRGDLPCVIRQGKRLAVARFVALLLAIAALIPISVAPGCASVTEAAADCCGPNCPSDTMPGRHTTPVHQPAHQIDCCKTAPQPPPAQATFAKANPVQEMHAAVFSAATPAIARCAEAAPVVRASVLSPPAATLHQLCSLQI
jgi:hypothetical protein